MESTKSEIKSDELDCIIFIEIDFDENGILCTNIYLQWPAFLDDEEFFEGMQIKWAFRDINKM